MVIQSLRVKVDVRKRQQKYRTEQHLQQCAWIVLSISEAFKDVVRLIPTGELSDNFLDMHVIDISGSNC
jgi:hypothetical protein